MNNNNEIKDKFIFSDEMLKILTPSPNNKSYLNFLELKICSEINPSIIIDFADPKGACIKIQCETVGYKSELNKIVQDSTSSATTIHYTFKNLGDDDKELEVSTKNINNYNRFSPSIISKDTIALISPSLQHIVTTYMKEINQDEILLLRKGSKVLIMPLPQKFIGSIGTELFKVDTINGNVVEQKGNKKNQKKLSNKEDLKVYETPSKLLHSFLSTITQSAYLNLVQEEISNKIIKTILGNKQFLSLVKTNFNIQTHGEIYEFISNMIPYINYKIMKSYNKQLSLKEFEEIEQKVPEKIKEYQLFQDLVISDKLGNIKQIFDFFDKVAKKGAKKGNYLSVALTDNDFYKKAIGRNALGNEMVFFDPQAGSAEGFFEAVDKAGLDGFVKMFGCDIREDIDTSKNQNRFRVIGGVNTTMFADTINQIWLDNKYQKASSSLLTWNNPPYSLDDGIAKDTIKMYASNMNLCGLYPIKLKKFLTNHLTNDSIMIEIPKEVTGYTDPKTPESFLLVIGTKKAEDSEYHLGNIKTYNFNGEVQDFNNYLLNIISSNWNRIGAKILNNIEYHKNRPFEKKPPLEGKLEEKIITVKELLTNISFFQKILKEDSIKNEFLKAVQPTALAKSEKVFIDNRFYSASNEYEYLVFNEVITNPPLLIHYAKHSPKIFDIIEQIAKESNITMPIDKSNIKTDLFRFGEKFTGEKVKTTTESLGMVKYAYYPDAFDMKDKKSVNILIDLIVDIYKDKDREITQEELTLLKKQIYNSSKLVTRIENLISVNSLTKEYNKGYTEVLCFVDDYGMVVGDKLPIPLYDLYLKMEEKGLLDIKDYIEVAELSIDNKIKIARGLSNLIKNTTLEDLSKYLKTDKDEFLDEILKSKQSALNKKYKKQLENYLDDFHKKTSKLDVNSTLRNALVRHLKVFYEDKPIDFMKEKIDNILNFIKMFYEDDKLVFFRTPIVMVLDKIKETFISTYQNKNPDEIDEIFNELKNDILMNVSDLNGHNEVLAFASLNLRNTIFRTFANIEKHLTILDDKTIKDETIKEKAKLDIVSELEHWEMNILKLMEHQINEPKSFIELNESEDIKDIYLLQKMRTGKTLKFLYIALLKMLKDGDDMSVILESKNIKDITQQMTKHMSFLIPMLNIFADASKHQFKKEKTFSYLPHKTSFIYPFVFSSEKDESKGSARLKRELGGKTVESLKEDFTKTIEILNIALEKKYPNDDIDIKELAKEYKNSKFVDFLHRAIEMCEEKN